MQWFYIHIYKVYIYIHTHTYVCVCVCVYIYNLPWSLIVFGNKFWNEGELPPSASSRLLVGLPSPHPISQQEHTLFSPREPFQEDRRGWRGPTGSLLGNCDCTSGLDSDRRRTRARPRALRASVLTARQECLSLLIWLKLCLITNLVVSALC